MEQTVTFHNGNTMPKVGLGTFRVEEGQELVEAVKQAIVSGYRSIDTARIYDNEQSVGEGIRQGIEAAGISRADLFITTKLWLDDYGYEESQTAYQASLIVSDLIMQTFIYSTGRVRIHSSISTAGKA